jgi:hypothetical protein
MRCGQGADKLCSAAPGLRHHGWWRGTGDSNAMEHGATEVRRRWPWRSTGGSNTMARQAWDTPTLRGRHPPRLCLLLRRHAQWRGRCAAPWRVARQGAVPPCLARQPRQRRRARLILLLDSAGILRSLVRRQREWRGRAAAPACVARQGCSARGSGAAPVRATPGAATLKQNVSKNLLKFTSNTWPSAHVPQSQMHKCVIHKKHQNFQKY